MYEHITPEYIKADILERFDLAATREGSYTNSLVSPIAHEIWKLYTGLEGVASMVFINEDSGPYIDLAAEQYGKYRKPGAIAHAEVTFTGADGVLIPAGKVFLTADNLQYTLDSAVLISGGAGHGPLTAADIGTEYNVPAGAIYRQLVNLSGITDIQSNAAEGGTDRETDAALFRRYDKYRKRPPTSGNEAQYESWAEEVDGVGAAKVFSLWAGRGTVKVIIVGQHCEPVDSTIVAKTVAHIESERPIGADVTVVSAAGYAIDVDAQAVLDTSTDAAAVTTAFKNAVAAYLESIAFREYTVVYTRIGKILMDIPGVIDYVQLTVNGDVVNITIGPDEVPITGDIEVTV